jgi:hypothetical protein
MILFSFVQKKSKDIVVLDGLKSLGRLIAKSGRFSAVQARQMVDDYLAPGAEGLGKLEFVVFVKSLIPKQVSDVATQLRRSQVKRAPDLNMEDLGEHFMKCAGPKSRTVDLTQLGGLLEASSLLPNWLSPMIMKLFGENDHLNLEQFLHLNMSIVRGELEGMIFDFFDKDKDGIWSPSECLRAGRGLCLSEWRNRMSQWLAVADECRVVWGKKGVCREWFMENMLNLY